ncbi:uncharacterized protein LOC62_07G009587 [Vanrija pseudolonga]|uniref:Uncharacterized protein n=1 Tax=Vanrija pseudolonga TaxID=143232 RepID=A0AAF1BUH7_9TREE|nr:hypothetical protein LOC62_07G009587 [Vanrija pseudolonga]
MTYLDTAPHWYQPPPRTPRSRQAAANARPRLEDLLATLNMTPPAMSTSVEVSPPPAPVPAWASRKRFTATVPPPTRHDPHRHDLASASTGAPRGESQQAEAPYQAARQVLGAASPQPTPPQLFSFPPFDPFLKSPTQRYAQTPRCGDASPHSLLPITPPRDPAPTLKPDERVPATPPKPICIPLPIPFRAPRCIPIPIPFRTSTPARHTTGAIIPPPTLHAPRPEYPAARRMVNPVGGEASPSLSPSPQFPNYARTPTPVRVPLPSLKSMLDSQPETNHEDLQFSRRIAVAKAITTITHFGPAWKKSCLSLIKAYIASNPEDEDTIKDAIGSICDTRCACVHHLAPTHGAEVYLLPSGFVDCRCGFIPPPTKRV